MEPGQRLHIEHLNYRVFLGNGVTRKFRNRKDAERFLARTNVFLTDHVMQINHMLTQLYTSYRQAWPYFHARTTEKTNQYCEIGIKVSRNLADVEQYLENCTNRYASPNVLFDVWRKLELAYTSLDVAATALIAFHRSKMTAYERGILGILSKQCKKSCADLAKWGKLNTNDNNTL